MVCGNSCGVGRIGYLGLGGHGGALSFALGLLRVSSVFTGLRSKAHNLLKGELDDPWMIRGARGDNLENIYSR